MLIEFRVQNHRSIASEQVLTMEGGLIRDKLDNRLRKVKGLKKQLLPVAALYGANASGKSNLLSALAFMQSAVTFSDRFWGPLDGGIPRDPFAWGEWFDRPSLFEVEILVDAVRYRYGFALDDEQVIEEWLHAMPEGRKQVWFSREKEQFSFGDKLRGENEIVRKLTRKNSLFLSAAVQHSHKQLEPIFRWFANASIINVEHRSKPIRRMPYVKPLDLLLRAFIEDRSQMSLFEDESNVDKNGDQWCECLRGLLKSADIGIEDVRFEDSEGKAYFSGRGSGPLRIFVKHHDNRELPLEEESRGTQRLSRVGPVILDALHKGSLVVVDELEASLHPLLAFQIVRLFNDPETNPNNAQLIFATHDTNLLGRVIGNPPLRRDQIWFAEKDLKDETRIYPLTDYMPRTDENMERGYLQGRYGAIPFLGDFSEVVKACAR